MAKIRFPRANSLKVIDMNDYNKLQSDDTRLYYDFNYTNLSNDCYFTKILQSDNLWLQFRTDVDSYNAYIYDTSGNSTNINTSIADGATVGNGTTQYELSLDLASYSGKYYLYFEFENFENGKYYRYTFRSNWFEVITDTTGLLKIEWSNIGFGTYNDGIIWADTQKIWVESRISDLVPGIEKTTFVTENYKLLNTQAQPIKSKRWQTELLPDYLIELLNIALSMGKFYINGIRYNSDSTFEDTERQGDTRLYPIQIVLRMLEDQNGLPYEYYEDDAVLTGVEFTPPQELRTTGLETRTTGVEDRTTNI